MKHTPIAATAAALLLGATGLGVAAAPAGATPITAEAPATATPATATAKTPKTLVVGVDGASFDVMAESLTPTVSALRAGGLTATSNLPGGPMSPTVSGPGWSTIATGVWAPKHRVTDNNFSNPNYSQYPDYLTRVEQQLPDRTTSVIGTWAPISTTIFGPAVDSRARFGNDTLTTQNVVSALQAPATDDVFVHLDEVDGAGHSSGSSSEAYRNALQKADGQIGEMVNAIKQRPTYQAEDWLIVVTSDHGHTPTGGHGGSTKLERKTFVAANGSAFAPGTERHDVKVTDIAPTVLAHLGLANAPEWDLDGSVINDIVPDDFDSLRPQLKQAAQEKGPEGLLGWTTTAPTGWSIDNSRMPSGGAPEFSGWSFMTDDFFSNVELGQFRENNVYSRNVFAVADSDEWADVSPRGGNMFDSTLKSPAYELNGNPQLEVSFVSDYAVDGPQKAAVWVAFDEASGIEPFNLVSYPDAGTRQNPVNKIERFTLDLPRNAAGELPTTASLHFEYAGNNSAFWAVDQVRVSQGEAPAAPANFALSAGSVAAGSSITLTGTGFGAAEELRFELRSAPQPLGAATADAAGAISTELTIPAGAEGGEHTVVLIRADGSELSKPLTVTAAPGTGGETPGTGTETPGNGNGSPAGSNSGDAGSGAGGAPALAATGGSLPAIALVATAVIGAGAYLVVRRRGAATPE